MTFVVPTDVVLFGGLEIWESEEKILPLDLKGVSKLHLHYEGSHEIETNLRVQGKTVTSQFIDVYLDSHDQILASRNLRLRSRYSVKEEVFSWTLVKEVIQSEGYLGYVNITDASVILEELKALFPWILNIEDAYRLIAVSKFTVYRTYAVFHWGMIAVDEVRNLPHYFWVCTVNIHNSTFLRDAWTTLKHFNLRSTCLSKVDIVQQIRCDSANIPVTLHSKPTHSEILPVYGGYTSDDCDSSSAGK